MRIGQNPAKFVKEVAQPERITVAVLNYIPFLSGFYAQMLDVLKTCLGSIYESADLPYDLMVFDNGSCDEVIQYLVDEQNEGRVQYLIRSAKNLGKGGAWNMIFGGAPGEIIAYTDNDCIFSKGWMSRSLEILETYPQVGMVTARPFRTPPEFYTQTVAWAEKTPGVVVEKGALVPFETLNEFNLSLGQTEEFSRNLIENSQDIRITYKNITAFVGGSHWQFMARRDVLTKFLPFQMDRPMGQVRQLDRRMNEAGYLRLMPTSPLAMNMSNTLDVNKPMDAKNKPVSKRSIIKKAAGFPAIKTPLLKIYDWIFNLYYKE